MIRFSPSEAQAVTAVARQIEAGASTEPLRDAAQTMGHALHLLPREQRRIVAASLAEIALRDAERIAARAASPIRPL